MAVGAAVWALVPAPPPSGVARFNVPLPEGQQFTNTGRQIVDVSPDGSQLLYVANQRLYLRAMADLDPRMIPGSDVGSAILNPVFSPDGREVAFFYGPDQTLRRMSVNGGAAVIIASATAPFGMRWDEEGLVFGQPGKGILRVSPNGGTPEVIAPIESDELASSPQLLPGGRGVLYSLKKAAEVWDRARVVVRTSGGEVKTLIEGGADGRYLPTGHLAYAFSGVIMAVPFDLERLEVSGGPVPVIEGVRRASVASSTGGTATAQFSVASTGALVYVPGPARLAGGDGDSTLAIFDGKGGVEPLKIPQGVYRAPRLSPDGKTAAFESGDDADVNVWMYDIDGRNAPRRLTFGGRNRAPVWSPDGRWIAFQSDREGDLAIFRQRADGSATAERLTKPESGTAHVPQSWSPDGAYLLFTMRKEQEVTLWTLSLKDQKTSPLVDTKSIIPTDAAFSPDGRWFAYQFRGDPNGTNQTFIQPFPATGAQYLVPQPGAHPYWSRKGDVVILNVSAGISMAVGVTTSPQVAFSPPVPVSRAGRNENNPATSRRNADALPDGRIIGVATALQPTTTGAPSDNIVVVTNWFEELRSRVPIAD